MKLHNFTRQTAGDQADFCPDDELFILCSPGEVSALRGAFGFDESTVRDCEDLDESVRYSSFGGYDFVSAVHTELLDESLLLREINLYISRTYLVLVMPEHNSPRLAALEKKILDSAAAACSRTERINGLYYAVFHNLLADFSDMLELLEDKTQALSGEIVAGVSRWHFGRINAMQNMTYTVKKQLRALSYLGEQILLDENKLIAKGFTPYFRSINTRLKKLYDFSESLYHLSAELLYTYDSRLTMKTNDTVNKLAAITLFFGPLTVITGIYGMNFTHMPELEWPIGYPLALGVMACVSTVLFIILRRKKWL